MHDSDPIVLPEIDNGLRLIRWTARGFDELRRRELLSPKAEFELVEGMILHREFPSQTHERVVAELARRLNDVPRGRGSKVRVSEEWRLEEIDTVLFPDIALTGRTGPPRLIVEVSDTAPRLDALEKERLYARAGVEEYWHIELAWNVWRTHDSPHHDGYGMRASGPSYRPTLTRLEGFEETTLDELVAAANAA